jgi:molybdenum cofactor cytidylyltransferase
VAEPVDTTGTVAGVVLAAGLSRRFGRNKLLLELAGEPVIRRAARTALAAGLDPVVVVVGHEAERAEAALSGLSCRAVWNPAYAAGQGTSHAAGLSAVPPEARAAVLLLADMPLVTPAMVAALVARWREGGLRVVTSEFGGVRSPPVLLDRALFAELVEDPGRPAREVVGRHRTAWAILSWPAERGLDLDAPGDLARIEALLAAEGRGR